MNYCRITDRPEPIRARVVPDYLSVTVGDMVEFRCHVSGGSWASIRWSRDVGDMPINAEMYDDMLRFQASREDHQGRYECHVISERGQTIATATTTLVIEIG